VNLQRPAWTHGDRWRFLRASLAGTAIALLVFTALLTRGTFDVTEWQRSGDFYDAQAHSFANGDLAVDGGILGIERWESHGQTYMYQGPWPALIRLPIAAQTERFDGRLTQLSMMAAVVVAMLGATRLHWRVRRLVRPDAPLARLELWAAAGVTFAVGAGSALLYEASRAWVYQEAAIWGAAWAIVSLDALVGCIQRPTWRRLDWAAAATALALCSRSSVGLGTVAGLGLIATGNLVFRVRPRLGDGWPGRLADRTKWAASAPRKDGRRPILGPGVAAFVPLALYATINYLKFHTLFSVPFWGQGFTMADPDRQQFLRVNGGTLFGMKWAPTTAVQYLRPDAIRFTGVFPFVDFPPRATPFSGVAFDLVDYSSSIPASMPVLTILAIVGIVVLFRRSTAEPGAGVASLRGPALAGVGSALTIIPFAYIANRYLADAVPALVVLSLLGLQVVFRRFDEGRPAAKTWPRRLLVGGLVFLALAGVWINLSLAAIFGQQYAPNVKDDVAADFLDARYDVPQRLGLDPAIHIRPDEELPDVAPRGQLVIIGDCDAMYLSDGMPNNGVKPRPWNPVERTEAGGRFLRRITFPTQASGTRLPIASIESDGEPGILWAEWIGGDGVVFQYDGPGAVYKSRPHYLPAAEEYTLDLVLDPRMHRLELWLDDQLRYESAYDIPADATVTIGENTVDLDDDVEGRYTGGLEPLPERTGLCQELRAEEGEGS
jgi:hypothetical protein